MMWPFAKKEHSEETKLIQAHVEELSLQVRKLNQLVQEFNKDEKKDGLARQDRDS
jgi:hypothetical protein